MTAFERLDARRKPSKHRCVFTGSSTIRLWTTLEIDFPDREVVNRGFGGARVRDAAELLHRVVGAPAPAGVVMYAGGNDLASLRPVDEVLADARRFVGAALALSAQVQVGMMSVIPHRRFWPIIRQVLDYNAGLSELVREDPRLTYIDVASDMLVGEEPPPARLFIDDEIHLSAAGYDILAGQVGRFVGRLAPAPRSELSS